MVTASGIFPKDAFSILFRCFLFYVPAFSVRFFFLGFLSFFSCQVVAQESVEPLSYSLPLRVAQSSSEGTQDGNGSPLSQLFIKVTELENLVQALTGRLEEMQHENEQLRQHLDLHMKDTGTRLRDLEAGQSKLSSPRDSSSVSEKKSSVSRVENLKLPEGSPEKKYQYAFGLLRDSKYESARKALGMFIERHPKHDLAGNAQYWIGETFYVREDFKKAAVAFLDGYKKYPKNSKAPDNLLKLALSMERLGKSKEACVSLKKLTSEYPKTSDAIKRRVSIERTRLKCL